MPYTKTITVYFPNERRMLHAQGIWIDKGGNQIPVRCMGANRLNKLAQLLVKWATKEDYAYTYLRNHPIFTHVLLRARELGLQTIETFHFENAYAERNNYGTLLY